jgi:hypothetical protein
MDPRAKIGTGPNDRPLDQTIAGTGLGILDDALAAGETLPDPPSEEVEREVRARNRLCGTPAA